MNAAIAIDAGGTDEEFGFGGCVASNEPMIIMQVIIQL